MLTTATRSNSKAALEATKQLLIWALNKKQDFHISCLNGCFSKYDKYERYGKFAGNNSYERNQRNYRYNNNDRYDRDDTYDNDDGYNDDDRYDRNDRYNNYDRYDRDDRYNSSDRYNRHERFGYDRYGYRGRFGTSRTQRNFNIDELHRKKVNFNVEDLKPFKKDFYEPHLNVLNRTEEEINEFRREHDIQIFGKGKAHCPPPILKFEELNLPEKTLHVIRDLNYSKPTPVQSQSWPLALSAYNMVGISQTGSGKTLSFMLPAFIHIQNQPPLEEGEGPIALVIAPTRELTQQILSVAYPFTRDGNLRVACVYGGSDKGVQRQKLRGAHICIATPGRFMDFLREDTVNLRRCTYCVLDEADRLLDMGFEPQISAIMSQSRPDRQMTMWSATWPKEVRNLAEKFLSNYVGLKFGSLELAANPNIIQHIHYCTESEKRNLLLSILNQIKEEEDNKTIIFAKTKRKTEEICSMLKNNGYPVRYIHGDLAQETRNRLLLEFRRGSVKIIVATSVLSRGLDITDIRYVINYDFPIDIENYVHGIGRTARCGNSGTAHTFFTDEDFSHSKGLVKILEGANQNVPQFLREEYGERTEARFSQFRPPFQRRRRFSNPSMSERYY